MACHASKGFKDGPLPEGITRLLLRIPVYIFSMGLGFLFGKRFILLEHRGRKSGLIHKNILEIVYFDTDKQTCYVASGWGEQSNWLKNIIANPDVTITIGNKKYKSVASRLSKNESISVMLKYSQKHPSAFKILSKKILGETYASEDEMGRKMADAVPVISFTII